MLTALVRLGPPSAGDHHEWVNRGSSADVGFPGEGRTSSRPPGAGRTPSRGPDDDRHRADGEGLEAAPSTAVAVLERYDAATRPSAGSVHAAALTLQRTAGNRAVAALVQRSREASTEIETQSSAPSAAGEIFGTGGAPAAAGGDDNGGDGTVTPGRRLASGIQRDPEDDDANAGGLPELPDLPNGEFELKLELKGERVAGSVRFSGTSASTPLKAKNDVGEPGPSAGDTSAQVLPTKMTVGKVKGGSVATSMVAALAKADLTIAELCPGLTVTADLKALEIKLEKGEIDVNVFKIGVQLQGTLSDQMAGTVLGDELLASGFGELLRSGLVIKVQGRVEVNADPSDLVRLQRMVQLNREIAANVKESVGLKRKLDAIEADKAKVKKKLTTKLSKSQRAKLLKRQGKNAANLKSLRQGIMANKRSAQALKSTYSGVVKGLTTKSGRLWGLAVKRAGGRALAYLVPGLNVAMAALDVLQVTVAIYKLVTGKARLGLPTGEEAEDGDGEGEGQGESAGTGPTGTGGTEDHAGGGDTGATQGEGSGSSSSGAGGGDVDGALEDDPALDDTDLGPEISLDEEATSGAAPAQPHAAAEKVLERLAPSDGEGGTPIDVEQLNTLIPPDLSAEEQAALLALLEGATGTLAKDPMGAMEAVQRAMAKVRPVPTTATLEDASGTKVTEQLPADDGDEDGDGDGDAGPEQDGKSKGTGKGDGEGPGGDTKSSGGPAAGKLKFVDTIDAKDVSMSGFDFSLVSGITAKTRVSRKRRSVTISFVHDGAQHVRTFPVVVDSRTADKDGTVTITAHNARNWEITDSNIHMKQGEKLTFTFHD